MKNLKNNRGGKGLSKSTSKKRKGAKHQPKDKRHSSEPAIQELQPMVLSLAEVNALEQRMRTTVDVLKSIEDGAVGGSVAGHTMVDGDVQQKAAETAKSHLAWVLRFAWAGMLDVVKHGNGEQATGTFRLLMDEIVYSLEQVNYLLKEKRDIIRNYARSKIEFPILMSRFTTQNPKTINLVLRQMDLAGALNLKIEKNNLYSDYTKCAVKIVLWISTERLRPSSIYRRIVEDLHTKDFCGKNDSAWAAVIKFHLDYFQSPKKRWQSVAQNLNQSLEGVIRDTEIKHLQDNCGPFRMITEMPKFKELLIKGRDSNVKTELDLFNRVKNKIIKAARDLMR